MKKFLTILSLSFILSGVVGWNVDSENISYALTCPEGETPDELMGTCVKSPSTYNELDAGKNKADDILKKVDEAQNNQKIKDCNANGGLWAEGKCTNRCGKNEILDSTSQPPKCVDRQQYMDSYCKSKNPNYLYSAAISDCYDTTVQQSTIIPSTNFSYADCTLLSAYGKLHLSDSNSGKSLKSVVKEGEVVTVTLFNGAKQVSPLDVLACGIKTGEISLWMIPFYIKYLIQFLLSIAGLVAIISIILGGYFYMFSGISEDKEKGKKAIMFGIIGFVLAISSWAIVNIVISILTR